MKITKITNWFKILRLGSKGELKASTFRQVQRDIHIVAKQLEITVGYKMYGNQFDTQRSRVTMMLEMVEQSDEILYALTKSGSVHNCFGLRWRLERLKEFLLKYKVFLNTYNNAFLEAAHPMLKVNLAKGLVVGDNLIIEGEEIGISK